MIFKYSLYKGEKMYDEGNSFRKLHTNTLLILVPDGVLECPIVIS